MNRFVKQVLDFDIKAHQGGKKSCGRSSGYGLAMKYFIYSRGFTLKQFAKGLGVTPQALNYILNESKQENFSDKEIDSYCSLLKLSKEIFVDTANCVNEVINKK